MIKPMSNNPFQNAGLSFSEARGFRGVNLYADPRDMSGEFGLEFDNLQNINGQMWVRPGRTGLFGGESSSSSVSSSSGTPEDEPLDAVPYGLETFWDSTGNAWVIFTAGGKIYKHKRGTFDYTELLDVDAHSFTFNSDKAQAAIYGHFLYIVDGAHPLVRIDLDGGVPIYSMNPPTLPSSAALSQMFLSVTNLASYWSYDGPTVQYNLAPDFNTGTNAPRDGTFFQAGWALNNIAYGGMTGFDTPFYPGNAGYLLTINSGPQAFLAGGSAPYGGVIVNPAYFGNAALHAKRFHVLLNWAKEPNNQYGVDVVIRAYSAADGNEGSFLQSVTQGFNPQITTLTAGQFDAVFDFSGIPVEILAIKVIVAGQSQNAAQSSGNIWVNNMAIFPLVVYTQFVSGSTAVTAIPQELGGIEGSSSSAVSSGSSSGSSVTPSDYAHPAADIGNVLDYINTSFTLTLPDTSSGSSSSSGAPFGIDLSRTNRINFRIAGAASWLGLSVATYLQNANTGIWTLAENGTSLTDDLTAMVTDISTIPASIRQSVSGIRITFLANPTWASPFDALQIGPLYTPGNLSIGLSDYGWYLVEQDNLGAQGVIESDPGPVSNTLTPTPTLAVGVIALPANEPVNAVTNKYVIGRRGGALTDIREVATVPIDANVVYGSDLTNPYYSWDFSTKTFTDNTPDSWLLTAPLIVFGREPAPANAQTIAAWGGRLWLGVGSMQYGSWLFNSDNSAALYFTLANSPNDPNLAIEGFTTQIPNDANERIVALVPFGTPVAAGNQFGGGLLALCERSVWMTQGTSATDFSTRQYDYDEAVGLVAMRGWCRLGANSVMFLGPDRMHVFPPTSDNPLKDIGTFIAPLTYPASATNDALLYLGDLSMDPAAFSKSWMLYHDNKMFVGCPQPNGSQNSVIWVWDVRVGGWTRWLQSDCTSALSVAQGNVTGADYELYTFNLDKQVYLYGGTADRVTPAASPVAIDWTMTTNGMRPGFFYRFKSHPLFYRYARCLKIDVEALIPDGMATVVVQGRVTNVAPSGAKSYTKTYIFGGYAQWQRDITGGQVDGEYVTLTLSGSSLSKTYIRGMRGWMEEDYIDL